MGDAQQRVHIGDYCARTTQKVLSRQLLQIAGEWGLGEVCGEGKGLGGGIN